MKRLFPILCVLLCGSFLLAEEDKAAEEIPDPAQDMIGSWQGVLLNREDDPVAMIKDQYRFLPSGTWEILEETETDGVKPQPQGWYKFVEGTLYLQPKEAVGKKEDAAISAELRDKNSFIIRSSLDDEQSLLFLKTDTLAAPSQDDLAGKWKITQKDIASKETRVAPYCLVLRKDGTYQLEQSGKELPKEWAEGTYLISGSSVQLKNKFAGTGLWQSPAFFLLDGKLRYNNSRYCVWCDKIQEKDKEKTETGKMEEKEKTVSAEKTSSKP